MSQAQFADAIGHQAIPVSTSVVQMTVPAGANGALVQVLSNTVRVTIDGTTPTASVGVAFADKDVFYLYGDGNLSSFKSIRESADATIQVIYFSIMIR
jgi:hypothetical protein